MPARRVRQYEVEGRHGVIDYGGETYEMRNISLKIVIFGSNTHEELRQKVRDVAFWLSGNGNLIFDDEPDKAYTAKVISQISLDQFVTTGMATVSFQCQPFAQTPNYSQINTNITTKPTTTTVTSSGTQDTPAIIIIKNIGTTTIGNIELQRKAVTT